MSAAATATWALLAAAVAVQVLSALGVTLARTVLDRLHFATPASLLAPALLAASVLVANGLDTAGVKTVLVAVVLAGTGPVLSHATARATRVHELRRWRARLDERAGAEQP